MLNIIPKILRDVQSFYAQVAREFSATRQQFWPGWNIFLPLITDKHKILDLGCGNGRFLAFLLKNTENSNFEYLGLDTNDYLLNEAKKLIIQKLGTSHINATFKNTDVLKNLNQITKKYDLITAFGLTHHIPQKSFRMKWFENVTKLLNNNGVLVLTFWDFLNQNPKKATGQNMEENDYYLGWGDTTAKRYCHFFNTAEINEIKNLITKGGLTLIDEFYADGRDNKSNLYLVFQRR